MDGHLGFIRSIVERVLHYLRTERPELTNSYVGAARIHLSSVRSEEELLAILRRVIASCDSSAIAAIYGRRFLRGSARCLTVVGEVVRFLRLEGAAELRTLVEATTKRPASEVDRFSNDARGDDVVRRAAEVYERSLLAASGLPLKDVNFVQKDDSEEAMMAEVASIYDDENHIEDASTAAVDNTVQRLSQVSVDDHEGEVVVQEKRSTSILPPIKDAPIVPLNSTIESIKKLQKFRVNEGAGTSKLQAGNTIANGATCKVPKAASTDKPRSSNAGSAVPQEAGTTLKNSSRFSVLRKINMTFPRFGVGGFEVTLRLTMPPDTPNPIEWLEAAFKELHAYFVSSCAPSDYMGITLETEGITRGTAEQRYRPARDFSFEDLWTIVFKVTQSGSEFKVDRPFTLRVTTIAVPVGQGRGKGLSDKPDPKRRVTLAIANTDNLCLPRSLVTSRVHAIRGDVREGPLQKHWDEIRNSVSVYQREAALALVRLAGVVIPPEGCGPAEILQFQQYLAREEGAAIVVYNSSDLGKGVPPLFEGSSIVREITGREVKMVLNIAYYKSVHHYQPILNMLGAVAGHFFCIPCNVAYYGVRAHSCGHKCMRCLKTPRCDANLEPILCKDCLREFSGADCYAHHLLEGSFRARKSVCNALRICRTCQTFYDASTSKHVCGMIYCRTCCSQQEKNHRCYMRPVNRVTEKLSDFIFVFYDFQTRLDERIEGSVTGNVRVPNLCVAQRVCTRCMGEDIWKPCTGCGAKREFVFSRNPVAELIELVDKNVEGYKQVICIAHNEKAFDLQFVLKSIVDNGGEPPKVTVNGSKIIVLDTGNARFLDSLSYMPLSLSALPATFGLPQNPRQGFFPHLFNTVANQGYFGAIPAVEYFSPDSMSMEDRASFLEWYETFAKNGCIFNFDRELVESCRSNVNIVRLACIAFREMFVKAGKVCPFAESITIASACSMVFRKNFLKDKRIGLLPPFGYHRDCNRTRKAIEWLVVKERDLGIEIRHAGRSEKHRVLETSRLVDGYYVSTDGSRYVFQFHVCYWQGCPYCHRFNRDKRQEFEDSMEGKLESTLANTRRMRELGYIVEEIWECEFDRLLKANKDLSSYVDKHPIVNRMDAEKLNPRDALYEGRTGNTSRYREVNTDAGEQIRYVDVCSLYPFVCKYGKFPIGHPVPYIGEDCARLTAGESGVELDKVEGLVKCVVLPPRNLYHPVLPLRMHGKLMFPLCYACCRDMVKTACPHDFQSDRYLRGTWVSDELKKAVSMGYKVILVNEVWQYETTMYDPSTREGGHFAAYVDTFLKIKQQASGWPVGCVNEEQRSRYVEEYGRVEGIQLEKEKVAMNPGLRSIAKLCLNSFWNKLGQRDNLPKTTVVKTQEQLLDLVTNPSMEVEELIPVNENVLYARWSYSNQNKDTSRISNVVIAAYTTAQARLKLYSYLEKLDRRVLYYDTDSIMYVRTRNPSEYQPPLGNFLGDLSDELESYGEGSYIRAFVSGGTKFYAFIVSRPGREDVEVCRVNGISMNYNSRLKMNFNSIRSMVVDETDPIHMQFKARPTALSNVMTRNQSRMYPSEFLQRRPSRDSYDTLPYGHMDL